MEGCQVGNVLVMWSVVYARFLNMTSGLLLLSELLGTGLSGDVV